MDFKEINHEINELAYKLVNLSEFDSAVRATIEHQICSRELDLFEKVCGKAYSLYRNVLNVLSDRVSYEVFKESYYDMYFAQLVKLLRSYDPRKGKYKEEVTFTSALRFYLDKRVYDVIEKLNAKFNRESTFGELSYEDEDGEEVEFDPEDPTDATEQIDAISAEIHVFASLAPLIADRQKAEEHLGKSQKGFFAGFFAFDITKSLRIELMITESEVVSRNDTLYPAVDISVTDCLLVGFAANMRDVARNPLKDSRLFDKRIEVIGKCCGISKPTVIARDKNYQQLRQSQQICVG